MDVWANQDYQLHFRKAHKENTQAYL